MSEAAVLAEVLVDVKGRCGRITLNRPKAMNALNLAMIAEMTGELDVWRTDPTVAFVLLDGAGERGLCAGGDIRALYDAARSGNVAPAAEFFRAEYTLNSLVAKFPKPYIAIMDGVVMGGGIGVSAHGSRRVVTERSMLAMPETGIGFIPDVGGTHLLGTAPGELGTYLALTASRMGAADAILVGMADMFVESSRLPSLVAELEKCTTAEEADATLRNHASVPPAGTLEKSRAWIDACFRADTVEEILAALDASAEPAAHAAASEIRGKSPTSLKVTLRALRGARERASLDAALAMEYRLAMAAVRAPDFAEGVRAAVVDKDRNPKWTPSSLDAVKTEQVERFFDPSGFGELDLEQAEVTKGVAAWNR